jgi:hypothetical protein
MRTSPFLFFFLLPILFTQCTKDRYDPHAPCIPHDNISINDPFSVPISLFEAQYPVFVHFFFNPSNSNELLFLSSAPKQAGGKLIKYNLKTQEKRVVFEGEYSPKATWGKQDWILLNIWDELGPNIYRIRSDGSGLKRLTTEGLCLFPTWNLTGDQIIYEVAYSSPKRFHIIDWEGQFIDSSYVGIRNSNSSWHHPELIANATPTGLNISNIQSDSIAFVEELDYLVQSSPGAVWLDEERVFWTHTTGVYVTNILTDETEVIRETCNARYYQRPTYAPDIDKIVLERCERIKDTETSGRFIVTPTMMNPDGSEEEVLEIEVD